MSAPANTIDLNDILLTEDEMANSMQVDDPAPQLQFPNVTLVDIQQAVVIWHEEFSKAVLRPGDYPEQHEHLLAGCDLLSELLGPYEDITTIIDHVLPIYVDSAFRGYDEKVHQGPLLKALKREQKGLPASRWVLPAGVNPPPTSRAPATQEPYEGSWLRPLHSAEHKAKKGKGKAKEATKVRRGIQTKEEQERQRKLKEEREREKAEDARRREEEAKAAAAHAAVSTSTPAAGKTRAAAASKTPSAAVSKPPPTAASKGKAPAPKRPPPADSKPAASSSRGKPRALPKSNAIVIDEEDVEETAAVEVKSAPHTHDPPCFQCVKANKACTFSFPTAVVPKVFARPTQQCEPCRKGKKGCSLVQRKQVRVRDVSIDGGDEDEEGEEGGPIEVNDFEAERPSKKPLEIARERPSLPPRRVRARTTKKMTAVAGGRLGQYTGE